MRRKYLLFIIISILLSSSSCKNYTKISFVARYNYHLKVDEEWIDTKTDPSKLEILEKNSASKIELLKCKKDYRTIGSSKYKIYDTMIINKLDSILSDSTSIFIRYVFSTPAKTNDRYVIFTTQARLKNKVILDFKEVHFGLPKPPRRGCRPTKR